MKGKKSVLMSEFVDMFCDDEDVPLEVFECCVDLRDIVYKYNNPYPFNPSPMGYSAFHFFYDHVRNPNAYIRPFKSLPNGNLLSIVSVV